MNMTTSSTKTAVGYGFTCLICTLGARSILSPIPASRTFGIPMQPATDKWQYVSVMGVRSFAFGIAVGALIYRGERKAAGVVMSTAALVGSVDAWAVRNAAGRWTQDAWGHIVGDGAFALGGLWLAME